jgi:multidrug transporter EmrE-like cation transporter
MVALTTFGQVMLKKGAGRIVADRGLPALLGSFLNPGLAWGLAASLAAPLLYIFALTRLPLAVAYSFTGLGFALVFAASRFVLGERVHPVQTAGVLLVVAGVAVFNT